MRLTVRASEVREGDRLVVPDRDGGEREIVVPKRWPKPLLDRDFVCLVPWQFDAPLPAEGAAPIASHREAWVVVERPDPPITITVQLTRADADDLADERNPGYSVNPHSPAQRALHAIRAAIVAARAGDTR